MAIELIAQGGMLELPNLGSHEDQFGEGDRGLLELELRVMPPDAAIAALADTLRQSGVELWGDITCRKTGSATLSIPFRKALAPLAIIAIAVAAVIFLVGLVTSWKLYKLTPEQAVVASGGFLVILALIAAVFVAPVAFGRK